MRRYIIRRIILAIPTIIGITLISFIVIHLAPGNPVDGMTMLDPKASSFELKQKLMAQYGLDSPIHKQYLNWVRRIINFDFGVSYRDGQKVMVKIAERAPITLFINGLSVLLILLIAIPIGAAGAVKCNGLFDRLTTIIVFIGFAFPGFWLALLLMSFFGIRLGWLPIQGIVSLDFDTLTMAGKAADIARHLALPVFVSCAGGIAGMSRYVRNSMLEVLRKDYIKMARAKGLKERDVIYKHALKNAILPVITILGLAVPGLIGGSVIFESVFGIPGMGRLFYESAMSRDYPVIMAVLVIGALLTLAGNILADIVYSLADPRVKYDK
ncbi:MAG: ABC transporter permease [Candidatus Omnitrophica bacterium]|jgi:peptide/nickel transport system permease protein|nr:ABC transporter permease [Candidatus Omnitrophota bacterium]